MASMIEIEKEFRRISGFVCPFCGALCDDLVVETDGKEIRVENACVLGTSKILARYHRRVLKPQIDGKEVDLEKAIEKSAEILVKAKKPLFYGFSSTTCEAQELAVELAEIVGGVIDCTSSVCHGPTILAVHEVGVPSFTLGEVKNRADLVIFWGCNPMHAHPRHMSRYSVFTRGRFAQSRIGRKVVVVDVRPTESSKLADLFIQIKPGSDYEIFNALRSIVNTGECRSENGEIGGVKVEKLKELAEMMKNCKFGVIFFGMGLTHSAGNYWNISEAISLVKDLYRFTKFGIMPMRGHYNVTGFNEVCTWETGYPFAVDFTKGYPWYNPGETDANSILSRRDADAMFVLGGDPAAHFPKATVDYMKKIPLIVVDPFWSLTASIANILIPSAVAGVEAGGSAYRMDAVPLKLRKIVDPPDGVLSDEEILKMLIEKVEEIS